MFIVLAVCLAGIVALLAIPVDVILTVQRYGSLRGQFIISWLFGMVRYGPRAVFEGPVIREIQVKAPPPEKREPPQAQPHPMTKQDRGLRNTLDVLKIQGFVSRAAKLVVDLVRLVRIRGLAVRGRVGLGDPAETGWFWGLVCASTGTLEPYGIIALEPDFERTIFEIDGRCVLRIIPLHFVIILTLFILSPSTIRAVWMSMRAGMRKRREAST